MQENKANYEKIKFSKCCEEWLDYKKTLVKESTYLNYKFIAIKHIIPILGNKTLEEIKHYDMTEFIKIEKKNANTSSLKGIIIRLKSILRYIKRKYGIEFDFDFKSGYIENFEEDGVEIFNEKERQRLYRYLVSSNDIREVGVLISLYSGLRIGEVCGLKWQDIDLENKVLYVKRTVQRVYIAKNQESKIVITPPKTRKSSRKIPISKVVVNKLANMKRKYDNDCFIITGLTNRNAEPLSYRYVYKQVLIKCGIPYKKFHCLRHTFATRCIRVGMDIKSLSEVLGHSNIGTTMNIYVHSSYEVKKKYIDRL